MHVHHQQAAATASEAWQRLVAGVLVAEPLQELEPQHSADEVPVAAELPGALQSEDPAGEGTPQNDDEAPVVEERPSAEVVPPAILRGISGRVITDVAARGPAARDHLVRLAQRQLQQFPWRAVEPGWIAEVVPEDALLRGWALATIPQELRPAVEDHLGIFWTAKAPVPPWFEAWFVRQATRRLCYPRRLPGENDPHGALHHLTALSPHQVRRALELHGLRAVAAAAYEAPRDQVAEVVFALPEGHREQVKKRVRERRFPPPAGWLARFDGARLDGLEGPEISARLALERFVVQARRSSRLSTAEVVRLGFLLPPQIGGVVDEVPGVEAVDADQFEDELRYDLRQLVAAGIVAPEPQHEEIF